MPAFGIKLADANVWLAIAVSNHIHHSAAVSWFDAQTDASCAFSRLTQLALLRHLTNSKILGTSVQSQQQAWNVFDALRNDPRVTFVAEPAAIEKQFRSFTQSTSASHERWTDAYLAALVTVTGSQFVTFDRGFRAFPELNVEILG